jgi:heme/copper-type cytochrome/quinol oxidase subunit 3
MVLFIATEAATFAAFLASYFYLRFSSSTTWPPPGEKEPDLLVPTVATVILVVSSAAMAFGSRSARRRARTPAALGVVGVLLGGLAFLVLQVVDWLEEWPSSTLSKDAYGSLFYAITGLHAAHVVVGVGMLAFLAVSLAVRKAAARPAGPVALVAMYWYFMAVVGVAVYVTVYLSPTR